MNGRISNIASRVNGDCEQIAVHLFGHPAQRLSNKREWRWGEHGRFRLHVTGPKCGKWSDFASGEHGDMLDLIGRELGLDKRGAIDWAKDWLGGDIGDYPSCPTVPAPRERDSGTAGQDPDVERHHRQNRALAIWNEAGSVTGTLAEAYLVKERGLLLPTDILAADVFWFNPKLYYDGAHVPGMVALMRDPATSEPVGIQRTFLTPDGKKIERRMLGSAGVVMLSSREEVEYGLGLAEGMENGLAVMAIAGWLPVWAAMSAGAIRNFPILAGIDALTIFADPEQVGMDAARSCARRWSDAGKEVTIAAPPDVQRDWNDELRRAAL